MKKLIFVKKRTETPMGVMLQDGRIISCYDENGNYYLQFDKRIDLNDGTFDEDSLVSLDDTETPCLNNFVKGGAKVVSCDEDECVYRENVYPNEFNYSKRKVRKICRYFAERGFEVSADAVEHQLSAWMSDFKSGYRDDKGGYFLFTPCGHNTLSIRLSILSDLCKWQYTYEC